MQVKAFIYGVIRGTSRLKLSQREGLAVYILFCESFSNIQKIFNMFSVTTLASKQAENNKTSVGKVKLVQLVPVPSSYIDLINVMKKYPSFETLMVVI